MKKKYFVLGRLKQPMRNKNIFYRHDTPNEPTKEVPLSIVLFESPFTSVSRVSRGHPSLVSLVFCDRHCIKWSWQTICEMEDTAISVLNIMNIMSFHLLQNSKPNPPIPGPARLVLLFRFKNDGGVVPILWPSDLGGHLLGVGDGYGFSIFSQ